MNFNKVITAVLCFSIGVKIGHADWKDDIDYTKLVAEYGDQLRSDVDVGVGMAEAGSNYSPNALDSKFANVTINLRSGSSGNSGHANSVASRIAGTGSILPGLTQLDVFQSSNWLSTYPNFLSTGPVDPEIDIVNHSWISTSAGAAAFTLQRSDYIIDVFDCLMVAGLNNNDSFPQLMGNMYNGITVGNTNGNHSKGGTNTDGSGRIKPDILGTNTATSYGTPVVTATATLVLNEAKGLGYDVVGNTEMLKALVLVGATKEEVSDWSHSSTKPLDEVFGLGEVNVYNSYRTLISGRVEASESDASNGSGWDFGTTAAQPNQYLIYHSGGTFSAVLTWHRVVDKGSSWFFMTTDLADLSMGLYQSDAGGVRGTEVFLSDSPVDNVEHVYEEGLAAGYYLIEIDGDQSDVSYGLAWRDEFTDTQVEDPEENVAVSFVGISNGEILTYGVEKAFQASVEGAVSDIEKVELFSGETLVHTESSSPYAFSITPDSLQNIDLELRVTTGIGVYTSSLSATVADGDLSLSLAGASADSEFTTGDVLSLSAEIDGTYHSVQSVSFRVNGNEIFNDLAAPFEMSWNPVLAGSYSLQVIALNGSGESFESEAVSVSLVDPIPDPVALSLSLSEASIELGEEVTLSATILGSEADLSSVEFYLGEVLIGSDSNAPYAITWVSESSGSFDFTARSVNTASLTASSGIASIVVEDPIPDAVAISLSVSSEEIETGSTTSLIAVPIGDAEALARVDFYLGETLIGSDSEAPYSIDWVSETAGSFGFTAKSVNTASLIASSGLATVVVSDPIPEAVAISLSVSNEEIETGNATLLTATPIGDGEFLARVDFYLGETLIGSDAVAPYSATWVSEGPGSFDFIARSVNTASLTATSETVMVVVSDPIPDAVAIDLSIGSAEIETGEWVSLTAAPIGDVESLVRVDFYLGETLLGSDSTSPYAIEWLGSEAGSYDFSARSVNSANLIYDSNVESLIVSDPILERDVIFVEITGLENRDYRVGESADIRVLVEGNLSPISQVSLFEGDELIKVESYATYDFPWSVGNVGLRTLKAVVETALGSYEKEALVDVLDASLDPAVELQGGSLAREVGETVSIEVFDTQGDGTVDSVEFSVNGSPLGELLEAPFVWKWTPALSGSYSITTKSKNLSGEVFESEPIIVEVAAPVYEPITLNLSSSESEIETGQSVSFSVELLDPDDRLESLALISNGIQIVSFLEAPYESQWMPEVAGTYEIVSRAVDLDGRQFESDPLLLNVEDPVDEEDVIELSIQNMGDLKFTRGEQQELVLDVAGNIAPVEAVDFLLDGSIAGSLDSEPYLFAWTPSTRGAQTIGFEAQTSIGRYRVEEQVVVEDGALTLSWVDLEGTDSLREGDTIELECSLSAENAEHGSVRVYMNGALLREFEEGPYAFSYEFIAPGDYEFTATVSNGDSIEYSTTSLSLQVSELENLDPVSIEMANPLNGMLIESGEEIALTVALANDSRVREVIYFQEGVEMARSGEAPFSASGIFYVSGAIELYAIAILDDESEVQSRPVWIEVSGDEDEANETDELVFRSRDIGVSGKSGKTEYDAQSDAFAIESSGEGLNGDLDSFRFTYLKMRGNASLVARLNLFDSEQGLASGGLLARSSLMSGSEYAGIMVDSGGRVSLKSRDIYSGSTIQRSSVELATLPVYLRLEKTDSSIAVYYSNDGKAWFAGGVRKIALGEDCFVGLALASNRKNRIAGALFDRLNLVGEAIVWEAVATNDKAEDLGSAWGAMDIQSADIGEVEGAGRFQYAGEVDTSSIRVASGDIWGREDSLHFAYAELSGDFTVVARLRALRKAGNWSKSGLMVRGSLDPSSPHASGMFLVKSRMGFLRRIDEGGETNYDSAVSTEGLGGYVKMSRVGGLISLSYSRDGESWTGFGSAYIDLPEKALVGLAISSGNERVEAAASFDGVYVRQD